MHGREKSDSAIVAVKPTNKAVPTAAEPAEPRAGTKGNANQQSMDRAQNRTTVSQALERIRRVAQVVRRHSPNDQARFLKQFAGRGRKRLFPVNRMPGRES